MRRLIWLTGLVLLVSLFICREWRSGTIDNARLDAAYETLDNSAQGRKEDVDPDLALPAEHPYLVPLGVSGAFFVVGLLVIIAHNSESDRRTNRDDSR